MNVLERITGLREQRKWTIWKLSEESGVDQSTISAWYTKGRSPSVASIEKICAAFNITMSQFFTDSTSAINVTVDQLELLESWSALSGIQKETIFNLIKSMV